MFMVEFLHIQKMLFIHLEKFGQTAPIVDDDIADNAIYLPIPQEFDPLTCTSNEHHSPRTE